MLVIGLTWAVAISNTFFLTGYFLVLQRFTYHADYGLFKAYVVVFRGRIKDLATPKNAQSAFNNKTSTKTNNHGSSNYTSTSSTSTGSLKTHSIDAHSINPSSKLTHTTTTHTESVS